MDVNEFEAMQGPTGPTTVTAQEKPKKKYTRRKKTESPPPATNGQRKASTKTNTVKLTPDQLARLWSLATGGAIIIDHDGDDLAFYVSMESFQPVLPALIDKI